MMSNAWPRTREERGATFRAIEQVLNQHPFFECFQTVEIPFPDERAEIRRLLREQGRPYNYTLTRVLGDAGLNLSAIDPGLRRRSWQKVVEQFADAAEAGASAMTLISGARPVEPGLRVDALRFLGESLGHICAEANARWEFIVEIEPLDYDAHKRNTLGTTVEAIDLCRRLAGDGRRLSLCLDTAHILLNGEDPVTALAAASEFVGELHLCNCVRDRSHPLFGDHHLPFGPPGVLDVGALGTLCAALYRSGYLSPKRRPIVYCEVRKPAEWDSLQVVAFCENTVRAAWQQARVILAG
jgi:sugar phosphate isomerase/epimerase